MPNLSGLHHLSEYLKPGDQAALASELRHVVAAAPLYTPAMPRSGRPFSVQMTNMGSLGWVSDVKGYRYQHHHPRTKLPWPQIPERILEIWQQVSSYDHPPEACLLNYYGQSARMGLHQDKDEEALEAPVVSISLGDTAIFRIGGIKRNDRTQSFKLASGDVLILAGDARLRHHGVDRLIAGSSTLLKNGGRINLTMRRVTIPS